MQARPGAIIAWTILSRTIPTKRTGMVAVHPEPAKAALLAACLRKRGVDGFCYGLQRLDEIAGREAPEGRPVDLGISELTDVLGKLDAQGDDGDARAAAAAAHLRTAGIFRSLARVHVTHEAAVDLGDALHAAGAHRFFVNRVDTIAGRVGFRPA